MREQVSNGGVGGFLGLLTILFIALKLTGYIGWSWWWVLSPIWLPPIAIIIVAIMIAAVVAVTDKAGR